MEKNRSGSEGHPTGYCCLRVPIQIPSLFESQIVGWRAYWRPDDKSGGHVVGWSLIIPYKFSAPECLDEVPVTVADLGGTEINLRFTSPNQGTLFVIVVPVLRFAYERVIDPFGPEVIGDNLKGKVLSMEVIEHAGRKYYQFKVEPPHAHITATAASSRGSFWLHNGSIVNRDLIPFSEWRPPMPLP